jgi:YD repeat-containing protein
MTIMIKQITSTLMLLLCMGAAMAQQNGNVPAIPAILPASPEAASLIKAGQLSVGLLTGSVNAGVPIYTITNRDLSYPIGLAYTSNGLRTDEIPGRAGMGWSVQGVGGVIARTVQGIPDEDANAPLPEPASLTDNNQTVYNYLNTVSNLSSKYDTRPDEYRYSVEGISGRFVIKNGVAVPIPYSKVQIQVTNNGSFGPVSFQITDMKGVKYLFGTTGAIETAHSYTMEGQYVNKQHVRVAWYLKKITSPEGAEINFNYASLSTASDPGFNFMAYNTSFGVGGGCNSPQCTGGTGARLQVTNVYYSTCYLQSATTNNGVNVSFTYEDRPDVSGEIRLKQVEVAKSMTTVKKVTLSYADPAVMDMYSLSNSNQITGAATQAANVKCKRFWLTQIRFSDPANLAPPLDYNLEYHDFNNLPQRLSFNQDFQGFLNTTSGNSGMIPNESSYQQWSSMLHYGNRYPDWQMAQRGVLKKVVYPTGGHEEMVYESNGTYSRLVTASSNGAPAMYQDVEYGGIRVKQVKKYDPVTQKTISTYYTYGTPQPITPTSIPDQQYDRVILCNNTATECDYRVLNENSLGPVNTSEPLHIQYMHVSESDDPAFANGRVEHEFLPGSINTQMLVRGNTIPNTPIGMASSIVGEEMATRVYNAQGQLLKETTRTFSEDANNATDVVCKLVRKRYEPVYTPDCDAFDVTQYQYRSRWIHLDQVVQKDFDPANGTVMTSTQNYIYGNLNYTQPTAIETTNSKGEVLRKEMKYPADFAAPGNVYENMVNKNIVTPVIEEKGLKAGQQLALSKNEFAVFGTLPPKPSYLNMQRGGGPNETRMRYHKYDDFGNPLELSKENDVRMSYIWDYDRELPVAEALNASWNDIAYTSFESNGTGNWSVPGSIADDEGFTGRHGYYLNTGSIVNGVFESSKALTYIIQYWLKNSSGTAAVNGQGGTVLLNKNGWTLYEHQLVNPATITISGTGIIDELRMFPHKAQMKTLTFKPEVGMLSMNDARGYMLFYEYDGYGRLLRVRDIDKNIIKQLDYKYAQTITPCTSTAPNWVPTGTVRCESINGTYTGSQEGEQRDMNNCSNSYWNTQWVNIGPSGNCPVCNPATCVGEDKKCVNGVCETGVYVFVSTWFSKGKWYCNYRYQFSDGSLSPVYTTAGSTTPCYSGGPS